MDRQTDTWVAGDEERRQWSLRKAASLVITVGCVGGAALWARSAGMVLGSLLVFVMFAATFLQAQKYPPGQDGGRPEVGRIYDGTNRVDAVRFAAITTWIWWFVIGLGVWDVLAIVVIVHRAQNENIGAVVNSLVTWMTVAVTVAVPLMIASACRARFVAVAPTGLVLANGDRRLHIPWGDLAGAGARTVEVQNLGGRYGNTPMTGFERYLVLTASPNAVAPPKDQALLHRFCRGRAYRSQWHAMPPIRVDGPLGLASPSALLRAIHWHLRSPHTPEALTEGYEHDWPEPARDD
jgi:hypothetical protein